MKKERIDVLLVEQGFFDSREKAKRAIMAGIVHDDYDIIDKPGTKIPIDSNLHLVAYLKFVCSFTITSVSLRNFQNN